MDIRNLFIIVLVGSSYGVREARVPPHSSIISCYKDDPYLDECAFENGKLALPHLMEGDKKYGIPKLNPLELEAINLETGENTMNLSLSKVKMFGLDTVSLERARIDLVGKTFDFDFKAKKILIMGKYDLNGRILSIPLQGSGDCNMTSGDVDIKFNLIYDLKEKNHNIYMELKDNKIDFETDKFHFHFDHLFNGNEQIGKSINKILNDEWKAIYAEFKPAVTETVSTIAGTIVKRMFERVPYNMIFI